MMTVKAALCLSFSLKLVVESDDLSWGGCAGSEADLRPLLRRFCIWLAAVDDVDWVPGAAVWLIC